MKTNSPNLEKYPPPVLEKKGELREPGSWEKWGPNGGGGQVLSSGGAKTSRGRAQANIPRVRPLSEDQEDTERNGRFGRWRKIQR